jgi:hypothetical protein
MTERNVTGDCSSCESTYEVTYEEELTSENVPEYCPFCGEAIEVLSENYIEDSDLDEDDLKWD